VFWWLLLACGVAALLLLLGVFAWISADPGIDRDIESARFRDEQEYRAMRRAGK
jgi:hypothetical protein